MGQQQIVVEVVTVAPSPESSGGVLVMQPAGVVLREETCRSPREARERIQALRQEFEVNFRATSGLLGKRVRPGDWKFDWERCCARAAGAEVPTVRIAVRE